MRKMKNQEFENHFIAVSGPMGVGKTTVAKLIAEALGYRLLEEHPEKNQFVADATKDPERWAFISEIGFLMLKKDQNKEAQKIRITHGVIQDTPIEQDVYSYGRAKLHGDEWTLFLNVYEAIEPHLMPPSLIICLQANTGEIIRRIRERDRNYETDIQPAYIQKLTTLNDRWIRKSGIPTLYVPTDHLNIVHDPSAQKRLIDRVNKQL